MFYWTTSSLQIEEILLGRDHSCLLDVQPISHMDDPKLRSLADDFKGYDVFSSDLPSLSMCVIASRVIFELSLAGLAAWVLICIV